ncbi:MAG TPA: hypothetical protein VEF04_02515 [Blastocatellia bacterium]|nr:hypothetical protein [Blastocatellia bacterium]
MADLPVPFPHMVLNSHNVPEPEYKMWNTWKVAASESPDHMMDWIATVAKAAPGGKLATLVFNTHGCGAFLGVGTGISTVDIPKFGKLKGLVDRIWLVACTVARITSVGDGNLFLSGIAKESGALVTGSTASQKTYRLFYIPYGKIDEWEGTVLTYGPKGDVVDVRHYPL